MRTFHVKYAIGALRKQRYITEFEDGAPMLLPVQWNVKQAAWGDHHGLKAKKPGSDSYLSDPERAYQFGCMGRHTTGAGHRYDSSAKRFTETRWSEPGDDMLFTFDPGPALHPEGSPMKHRRRYNDWLQSKHAEVGAMCWDCRDPHRKDGIHKHAELREKGRIRSRNRSVLIFSIRPMGSTDLATTVDRCNHIGNACWYSAYRCGEFGRSMAEREETLDLGDEDLMRRYQTTLDAGVFERLVERHWRRGFAVAVGLLRDRHAAEDALQEAFMRLLRRAERYEPSQSFASWFYVILRNTCLDMQRRRQSAPRPLDGEPEGRPSRSSVAGEDREALELLARLSAADRDVLVLRIVHGMSFSEIAPALGCSEEAARKRAQRALRRLRRNLPSAEFLPA